MSAALCLTVALGVLRNVAIVWIVGMAALACLRVLYAGLGLTIRTKT